MSYTFTRASDGLSINFEALGTVQNEDVEETSQLIEQTMPLTASSGTNVYDYMGVARHITLSGVFTSATGSIADLQAAVAKLHQIHSGNQTTGTYVSALHGSIIVKTGTHTVKWADTEGSAKVGYTITFTEALSGV